VTIQEPSSEKIVFFQLSRGANAEAKIPKPTPLQQQLAKVAPNGYDEDGEEQQGTQQQQLCENFGDELEEAYTSYIERSGGKTGGTSGMTRIKLEGREILDHVFIDGPLGNKMKVKTHILNENIQNKPTQQLSLLLYQQCVDSNYVLFVFAVYNGEYEGVQGDGEASQILVKKSYIFVRRSYQRMKEIFQSMCREHILNAADEVLVLKNMRHLETIKFEDIRDYQFADEDSNLNQDGVEEVNKFIGDAYGYIELKLTLCKPADACKVNFVPVIY
jgi:hypothetical protein